MRSLWVRFVRRVSMSVASLPRRRSPMSKQAEVDGTAPSAPPPSDPVLGDVLEHDDSAPPVYREVAPPIYRQNTAWYRKLRFELPSYSDLEWYEHPAFKIFVMMAVSGIVFGIYFGELDPIRIQREQFTLGTCQSLNLSRVDTRCCDVQRCSCVECPVNGTLCSLIASQPLNASTCCSQGCCAQTCWDTCTRQVCKTVDKVRTCHYESYRCNEHCCPGRSVVRSTCPFLCGLCVSYAVTFRLLDRGIGDLYHTAACGRDQSSCRQSFEAVFSIGRTWNCYYNRANPAKVRFDGIPPWNVAAWVFFSLFCAVWLGMFLYWWGYPAAQAAWYAASR